MRRPRCPEWMSAWPAQASTCNSHSVGEAVETFGAHVHDTGGSAAVHPMSLRHAMMTTPSSTAMDGRSLPQVSNVGDPAAWLSPTSTAATKTDEYSNLEMTSTATIPLVDLGDGHIGHDDCACARDGVYDSGVHTPVQEAR